MVVYGDEKLIGESREADCVERFGLIIVAGVSSGVGKTSVAESVVTHMAGRCRTAGAKITVTHGDRGCPHGGKGCDVCGSLGGDFQIITRPGIIEQPGTDTARLSNAGASPVLWTITREEFVSDAWSGMKRLMGEAQCAVIESNTLAERIRPSLTIMIADPAASRRLWKASAERLIASADFLIFNDRGTEDKRRTLLEEIESLRGSTDGLVFVRHPREVTTHAPLLKRLDQISLYARSRETLPKA